MGLQTYLFESRVSELENVYTTDQGAIVLEYREIEEMSIYERRADSHQYVLLQQLANSGKPLTIHLPECLLDGKARSSRIRVRSHDSDHGASSSVQSRSDDSQYHIFTCKDSRQFSTFLHYANCRSSMFSHQFRSFFD